MTNRKEKEPENFTVNDRRRFSEDGDPQTSPPDQGETTVPEPPVNAAVAEMSTPAGALPADGTEPEPLTAEERAAGQLAYQQSTEAMDNQLRKQVGPQAVSDEFKIGIERVIEPFYVTAMMQLGMIGQEGAERRVDIIGARQTIDTLNYLLDKINSNLTPAEHELFENVIYQLRMSYLEITNALAKAVQSPAGGAPKISQV